MSRVIILLITLTLNVLATKGKHTNDEYVEAKTLINKPVNQPPKLAIENAENSWCTQDDIPKLIVKYTERGNDPITIKCGEDYKLTALFNNAPVVTWKDKSDISLNTLVMLDPDAPSRKQHQARNWLHWLVVNIKGSDIANAKVIKSYNPPTPPKDSGPHRYIFLLLKQDSEDSCVRMPEDFGKSCGSISSRAKFNISKYAKDHDLKIVSGFTYFTTKNGD